MILQIKTEKELIEMVSTLKKECERLSAQNNAIAKDIKSITDKKPSIELRETIIKEVEIDASVLPTLKKLSDRLKALEERQPSIEVRETIVKEVEKPTVKKTTIVQTDPSVLPTLKKLSDRLNAMENRTPTIEVRETIVKEIEKPTNIKTTVIKTDPSVLPTLKKLSDRIKVLEGSKPEKQIIKELTTHEVKTVDAVSKKEIESLKKSISEIKPIINNITQGVSDNDVLSLINKHVTIHYVNKLYKRAK